MKLCASILFVILGGRLCASVLDTPVTAPRAPQWSLLPLLELQSKNPARLLRLAEQMNSQKFLEAAYKDPLRAYDWQERLAMVGVLSEFFRPQAPFALPFRKQAQALLCKILLKDPSLLVRDGAVESIRRIMLMRPSESTRWRTTLEEAFVQKQNMVNGEGLFIRETILHTMREASLPLSTSVTRVLKADKNLRVRNLKSLWDTHGLGSPR